MNRLEDHLVLNRFFHHLLGVESFDELKALLRLVDEGQGSDGQSLFYSRLVTQPNLLLDGERLRLYDRRVMEYESRLAKVRSEFKGLRYFQYLALLYTEVLLDRLTDDPALLLHDLNTFLIKLRHDEPELREFPDFVPDDLRRLAFFMATGSGKTLLLHAHVWQVLFYLKQGHHPEALVRRADGDALFDNILLITPNEGLSAQHIGELRASGIEAGLFIENPHSHGSLFGPKVKVIEIHKLAEEPSRDGVSVVLAELGSRNLVFVDEGHKGTGSEARVWKTRQQRLSQDGFLLEYSATFAQAVAAASRRVQEELLTEYGKAILFDYSYAHFYGDGYGKDFKVLNLARAQATQAHELLLGGLLTFYHQRALYDQHVPAYRPYNVEKPLWVLLGSSVNALYTRDRQRRSDVAEVVAFLRRCVEDHAWTLAGVRNVLAGNSGFLDKDSGFDLFAPHVENLLDQPAEAIREQLINRIFHGSGALEVWEIKNAEGEIGLRASISDTPDSSYFGVINIGDVSSFKAYLKDHLQIEVQEDRFSGSLFAQVNQPDSPINILIGAKRFVEGWSSWRVSSMGLLNVGKGEGSQVIQLFGRGVRLKGKGMSLKRSEALSEPEGCPEGLRHLETLYLFGWNADYIQTFRSMLDNEDIGREFTIPVAHPDPWPQEALPVPQRKPDFDLEALTWTLTEEVPGVELDLTPRLTLLEGSEGRSVVRTGAARAEEVRFADPRFEDLLDLDNLHADLVSYKQARGYHNVFIPRQAVAEVLRERCTLRLLETEAKEPRRVQEGAGLLLKKYLDRFVRYKERETESQNLVCGNLVRDQGVVSEYRVRVKQGPFLRQIEELLKRGLPARDATVTLPRLYWDKSLFNPVLVEGDKEWKKHVSVRPPALNRQEHQLITGLKTFWSTNHSQPPHNQRKVYLLRNLPRTGIGLFYRSGFYPDFILWLKDEGTGATHIRFIDPHGLHHDGLKGTDDKFEALQKLSALSQAAEFTQEQITLDGFVLTDTKIEQIPDAAGRNWQQLQAEYPLLRQEGEYCKRLLEPR